MTVFGFRVTDVFRVSGREGLVVTGVVLQGSARPGTELRDVDSGRTFALLAIDLACPHPRREHDLGLLVPNSVQELAEPGRVWVSVDGANDE